MNTPKQLEIVKELEGNVTVAQLKEQIEKIVEFYNDTDEEKSRRNSAIRQALRHSVDISLTDYKEIQDIVKPLGVSKMISKRTRESAIELYDNEYVEGTEDEDQYGKLWVNKKGNILSREVNGIKFNVMNAKTEDYTLAVEATGYDIKTNVVNDYITAKGKNITDAIEELVIGRVIDYGMKSRRRIEGGLTIHANAKSFHPVHDYLNSLEWDGEDHFSNLMSHIYSSETESMLDSDYNVSLWRKWFLGSVRRAFTGRQNYVLTLAGNQDIGKSWFCDWLSPSVLPKLSSPIHPNDKDYIIRMAKTWIWEIEELDATTRKADVAALKGFISTTEVTVRLPYGKKDIVKPALANYIGTINPDGNGHLVDTTGNRRFATVPVNHFEWEYDQNDSDQLWAQMYAEYKDGAVVDLTKEEKAQQNTDNNEYTTTSVVEQYVDEHLNLNGDGFMTSVAMLTYLEARGLKGSQHMNAIELKKTLFSKGVTYGRSRVNGKQVRGYHNVSVNILF